MLLSSGSGPSELCESRALHGDKRGILRKSDYREVKPQSKAELISGISKFWETASARSTFSKVFSVRPSVVRI